LTFSDSPVLFLFKTFASMSRFHSRRLNLSPSKIEFPIFRSVYP